MFVGMIQQTIDSEGRVSIPDKMVDVIKRKYNDDSLYIVLMPGNIICAYPGDEIEKLKEELDYIQKFTFSDISEVNRIYGKAHHCRLDSFGRIVLPPEMSRACGIHNEVLIVGARSHIEMWDPKLWKTRENQMLSDISLLRKVWG